jgi:hypothetical protein
MTDVKLELETVEDYGFQCNPKIYEANEEAYKKFTESLTLPEAAQSKKAELIKLLYDYVF